MENKHEVNTEEMGKVSGGSGNSQGNNVIVCSCGSTNTKVVFMFTGSGHKEMHCYDCGREWIFTGK